MPNKKPTSDTFWSGLESLDQTILPAGLPKRSLNVIGGEPGTGKTVLALQMLFANATPENRAVYFTTISEPTVKFLAYLQDFDFYDPDKMFNSIVVRDIGEVIQTQPLPQVIQTITQIIVEENAKLVVIDSFKAISDIVPQADQLRIFAYNLAVNLVSLMCTTFLVGEYTNRDMSIVPVFAIADGIFFLHFQTEGLNRQRYLEVHKVRGRTFVQGLHPFTIGRQGITTFPRIRTAETFQDYEFSTARSSTGVPKLDEILQGGLPTGTATMIAGGAGTGKTLFGMYFIMAGIEQNEPGAIVTFQENPAQLRHIAGHFGWDLPRLERQGLLVHLYNSPVEIQPDIHTARVKEAVRKVGARRVLIDSLKDLEIATRDKVRYKDYIYSLVSELKQDGITIFMTNEISQLFGSFSLSEFGVSFIADNVILLRYVEKAGRMARALNVLKVRSSQHKKEIYQYQITDHGLELFAPMTAVTGVLTGTPVLSAKPGWEELEPTERYILGTLHADGAASWAELQKTTMIDAHTLGPLLADLVERGYLLTYQLEDQAHFKLTTPPA